MTDLVNSARRQEEALSYALGHRIRIEILCLLNEAVYSAVELAAQTPWSLPAVSYHVRELLKKGSIELAKVEKVRNVDQHFYRAVELPEIDDAEAAELPEEVKQEYAAVILQAITAEGMAALRTRKLSQPCVRMMWSWFNLDQKGRQELADEQRESWERIGEIEARAINRQAKSGEEATSMIAAVLGFERSSHGPSAPQAACRLAPHESP